MQDHNITSKLYSALERAFELSAEQKLVDFFS